MAEALVLCVALLLLFILFPLLVKSKAPRGIGGRHLLVYSLVSKAHQPFPLTLLDQSSISWMNFL